MAKTMSASSFLDDEAPSAADFLDQDDQPSVKDKVYKSANSLFKDSSVINVMDAETGKPTGFKTKPFSEIAAENNIENRPVLTEGADIVDGLSGIAEIGARKGYAGIGRISAGAIKMLADVLGSDTLSNAAQSQRNYANEIENGAVLRGTPVEGFAKESIVQDLPEAGTNAIGSVITSAPALGAAVLTGGSALPAIFATTGAQEYGQGREDGLNPAGAAIRAIPNAAFEVIGEKIGGIDNIADALRAASKGNGVADLGAAMLSSAVKELPSEEFTTAGQFLTDKAPGVGLNQEAGVDEYLQQAKDTALATILQSAGMGGAGSVLKSAGEPAAEPVAEVSREASPDVNDIVGALLEAQAQVVPAQELTISDGTEETAALDDAVAAQKQAEYDADLPSVSAFLDEADSVVAEEPAKVNQEITKDTLTPESKPKTTKTATDNPLFEKNRDAIESLAPKMNWGTIGNKRIDDEQGNQVGRTKYEPLDDAMEEIRKQGTLSYNGMRDAVAKALNGEPLSSAEKRTIDLISDYADNNDIAISKPITDEQIAKGREFQAAEDAKYGQDDSFKFDDLFYGEESPELEIAYSELNNDDLLEGIGRELTYDEVEAIFNSKGTQNDETISDSGIETQAGSNDTRREAGSGNEDTQSIRTESDQQQPASVQPQKNDQVTPIVETLVNRRAAANQLGKAKAFDAAIKVAKDFMNGEQVSPTKFKNAASLFKNDKVLAEKFNELHELAKAPAKEARAEKTNTIEAYKQRIAAAKTADALQTLAGEIQRDSALSDSQAATLDDAVFDAQDALDANKPPTIEVDDNKTENVDDNSLFHPKTEKSPKAAPVKAGVKLVETVLQGVEAAGWAKLAPDDANNYTNSEGNKFRTYKKDGVRIALRPDHSLLTEKNTAIVYNDPDSGNVIIEAILVDDGVRKQGKATKTIKFLNGLADKTNSTLYIEPVPLGDKPMSKEALVSFYAKNGFVAQSDTNKVMVRKPNQVAGDLLGDNTSAKQAVADAERAKDAKRNTGNGDTEGFTLTGSNSEADKAAASGAQVLFSRNDPFFSLGTGTKLQLTKSKSQFGAKVLNKALVKYFGDDWGDSFESVDVPDALLAYQKEIKTAFGKELRYVSPTSEEFDIFAGVQLANSPNSIYVNARAETNLTTIAGHELYHALERSRPDLHKWFKSQAEKYIQDFGAYHENLNKKLQEGEKPYKADTAWSELLADFTGDALSDTKFLQELANADGNKFKELLNVTIRFLNQSVLKLKNLGSSKYISDVEALRDSLKKALLAFSNGTLIESEPKQADGDNGDIKFSRKPLTLDTRENWIFRRDELGRIQLTATGKMYDVISNIVQNIADKAQFGMASPELRKLIRHFKADMAKALESASNVAKKMAPMSAADRILVSDVVEKMVKTGVIPPDHIVKIAAGMQQTMDTQTDELVKLGMLSQESADRWRGKYLPRFYNREQDPALNTLAKKLLRTALPVRGMGGGSLKGRGLYEEINVNELSQWEPLGWEVRDPLWKKNQNGKLELIAPNKVRDTDKVMVWRDFTPSERESMGENRDALFRYVMGYTAMQNDIALGRMFDSIAKNQEWTRSRASEGYTKIPDSDIPETGGVKKYGNLAGLYVRDDIIQHITQYEEAGELLKFYRKALSFWKMGKTVLNPVSHMNNVVSNLTMAHFAGVSYWETHKYIGAINDFVNNAPMIQEAKDVGLMTGDITRSELIADMPADIKAMMNQQDSKITKSSRMTYNILTFFLTKPMSHAYRFEDDFFKYLIYKDARNNGVEPDDAVDYATRYIFNYDDLPKGARAVRDAIIPFFAYTYKAVPALAHTAFNYPWRFAAPALAIGGLNALMYGLVAGDDDDEWQEKLAKGKELEAEERKNLPPWMQGKSALGTHKSVRLGTDETTDLPVFIDLSRMIPGGDVFDITNQTDGMPLPAPIMPSNPVLTSIAAILWNKDTFSGKDVVDTNDTPKEASQKRAEWLLKQLSPAVAPTGYHADRLMQAGSYMADTTIETPFKDYTGYGKDGLPVQPKYAAAQTVGIKVRPVDLSLSQDINRGKDMKEMGSIKAEIRQAKRLLDKGAMSQREYDRQLQVAKDKIESIRSDD